MVLDVKGELADGYGSYLKEKGYQIKCLNLKEMEKSNQYDPFHYIRKEEDIIKLVTNIQANTTPPDAMRTLLSAAEAESGAASIHNARPVATIFTCFSLVCFIINSSLKSFYKYITELLHHKSDYTCLQASCQPMENFSTTVSRRRSFLRKTKKPAYECLSAPDTPVLSLFYLLCPPPPWLTPLLLVWLPPRPPL